MQVAKHYLWAVAQMLAAALLIVAGATVTIHSAVMLYDGYAIAWSYRSMAVMIYKTIALLGLGSGFVVLLIAVTWLAYWVIDHAVQTLAYGRYLAKGGQPQWFHQWQRAPDVYAQLAFPATLK